MRELPVDLDEIAVAMSENPDYGEWYLNTETGEVFILTEDMMFHDPDEREQPTWMDERAITAWREIRGDDRRWEQIPHISSHDQWSVMARFVETVSDDSLRDRLEDAIDGRGAFSRFRRVLSDYPEEQKRWRTFEDEADRGEVIDWLATLGIRPVPRPRPGATS